MSHFVDCLGIGWELPFLVYYYYVICLIPNLCAFGRKMEIYKKCFVPTCNNDTKNSSKTIARIREDLREKWCHEVNVEYFKGYAQYCCEDHFDLKQDLKNMYFKSENQEPRFKPTAKLRNIAVSILEEIPCVSQVSQPDESELKKLLLNSQTQAQTRKRKYEDTNMPSTSGVVSSKLFKVQVAVQATVAMVDKSTITTFKTHKPIETPIINILSQPSSSSTVSESSSLFNFTSESEETETISTRKEYHSRKLNLEKIYRKPKMYLGLPKQYTWLIDLIVEKSSPKIDSLCIIVTLLKIKQNDTVERVSDDFEISRTKLSSMILMGIEALCNFFQNFIISPPSEVIKKKSAFNIQNQILKCADDYRLL